MIFQVGGFQFQNIVFTLENIGLRDLILPFILIFTILFAVLEKVKVFKEKRYNSIISMVIALLVVIPHVTGRYPPGTDVVEIINSALPGIALWLVIIVSLLILIGVFNPGLIDMFATDYKNWITGAAVLIVIYVFGSSANWWQTRGAISFLGNPEFQALLIVVAVFWVIIAFVSGGEKLTSKELEEREKAETEKEKARKTLYGR